MRKQLVIAAFCTILASLAIGVSGANAATRVSPYRTAALRCDAGHSLNTKLTGSSIGFLRGHFVPCVTKALRGSALRTSAAMNSQVAHDARAFVSAKASSNESAMANNQFNKSGGQLCPTAGTWAWTLADNVPSPTLTLIVLAKRIDQAFFASTSKLGQAKGAIFGFAFVHDVFFHDGRASDPLGFAGFVTVCSS